MRLPKSFIERDIRAFTEIGKNEQSKLLKKLLDVKSLNCSVIGNQQTNSPHEANYCDQLAPEYLPSMAATDISSQQQQVNDFVVEPKLTESVINLDNILQATV